MLWSREAFQPKRIASVGQMSSLHPIQLKGRLYFSTW